MPDEALLGRLSSIAALVRDVGVILGIPVVLTIGLKLYDLQTKALEAQMKAVEAQNEVLKQTQYDRALTLMKSQKEIFENERASLETQINKLSTSGKDQSEQIAKLQARISALDAYKRSLEEANDKDAKALQQVLEKAMKDMKDMGTWKLEVVPQKP